MSFANTLVDNAQVVRCWVASCWSDMTFAELSETEVNEAKHRCVMFYTKKFGSLTSEDVDFVNITCSRHKNIAVIESILARLDAHFPLGSVGIYARDRLTAEGGMYILGMMLIYVICVLFLLSFATNKGQSLYYSCYYQMKLWIENYEDSESFWNFFFPGKPEQEVILGLVHQSRELQLAYQNHNGLLVPVITDSLGSVVGVASKAMIDAIRNTELGKTDNVAVDVMPEKAIPGGRQFHLRGGYVAMTRKGVVELCSAPQDPVGYGVRIGDHLITARHVALGLDRVYARSSTDVYHKLTSKWVHADNCELSYSIVPKGLWAVLAVRTASIGNARLNQPVHLFAEVEVDNKLTSLRHTGSLVNARGGGEVRHTCTSSHGYSGTPIFAGGAVVAIHIGGLRQEPYNTAMVLDIFKDLGVFGHKPVVRYPKVVLENKDGEYDQKNRIYKRDWEVSEEDEQLYSKEDRRDRGFDEFVNIDDVIIDFLQGKGDSRFKVYYQKWDDAGGNRAATEQFEQAVSRDGYLVDYESVAPAEDKGLLTLVDHSYLDAHVKTCGYAWLDSPEEILSSLRQVGVCERKSGGFHHKMIPLPGGVTDIVPELKSWAWPKLPRTFEEVSDQLEKATNYPRIEVPRADLDKGLKKLTLLLPTLNFKPVDWSQCAVLHKVVDIMNGLKRDSTPGFPYSLSCRTNEEVLESHSIELAHTAASRIHLLSNTPNEEVEDMCKAGDYAKVSTLVDPLSPFGKWEVHSDRKLSQGKVRMILSGSVVDLVVESFILGPLIEACLEMYPLLPVMLGIGFDDLKTDSFGRQVEEQIAKGFVLTTSDASHWDGIQNPHLAKRFYTALARKYKFSARWLNTILNLTTLMAYAFYYVDGKLLVKDEPKGMASGKKRTSFENSWIRLLTILCQPTHLWGKTAGDDAIDATPKLDTVATVERYRSWNIGLRDVEVIDPKVGFSFCSHFYHKVDGVWVAALESWPKALYKLLTRGTTREQVEAFRHETRHNSKSDKERFESVMLLSPRLAAIVADSKRSEVILHSALPRQNMVKQKRTSKKKSAPKPTSALVSYGKPSRGVSKPTPRVSQGLVAAACSNLDPWCEHANNAKRYDLDSSRTVPWQVRQTVSFGTLSSGYNMIEINANLNQLFRTSSGFTGSASSGVSGFTQADGYSDLNTNFSKYRVVSMGVRAFCQASPLAAQGTVVIATTSNPNPAFDTASNTYEEVYRVPLFGADTIWFAKPQNPEVAFKDISDTVDNAHTHCYMGLSGCAASASSMVIEIILNIELQPLALNMISTRLSTPAYSYNPLIMAAVSSAQSSIASASSAAGKNIGEYFRDLAIRKLKIAMASYLGGPVAGGATQLLLTNG